MSIIIINLSGFPHLNVFMSHAFRVETFLSIVSL
ncbi:hypothetical protein T01_13272 [Trichinella spiralis]|uniref:Uncharacterized protein n=1 Tax=Trichinella spiralis TaxID=6334 RepID=A0A0V0ZPV7_TRISP|nr:hypothetical protein T01_13272 [Trichinella spiralis]